MKIRFLQGGWEGHRPADAVDRFALALRSAGAVVEIAAELDRFTDPDWLRSFDVISPCWTMGQLAVEWSRGLCEPVRAGTGLAGIHGGMGDAFRGDLN